MKAKKLAACCMGLVLTFSLAACSGGNSPASTEEGNASDASAASASVPAQSSGEDASQSASVQAESEQPASEGGNTLVVYYSATGNTEEAANYIAQATGGDLFELEPVEPYTDEDLNWSDENSRVSVEHENEDQREVELVSTTVENWDSYDTVFIGYPIWWRIAAWPVDSFVENNDFTGKTVIPFATSASSGVSQEDVQSWIDSLNL